MLDRDSGLGYPIAVSERSYTKKEITMSDWTLDEFLTISEALSLRWVDDTFTPSNEHEGYLCAFLEDMGLATTVTMNRYVLNADGIAFRNNL